MREEIESERECSVILHTLDLYELYAVTEKRKRERENMNILDFK